jgi:cystathionine beta-lyase/cystathionine gamma-synthase
LRVESWSSNPLDPERDTSNLKFRTRAIHAGNQRDQATGAVVPPIHVSSTYVQPGAGEWAAFDYARTANPTRKHFEDTLASLESGTGALAFASGMAATHCVTMLLSAGDHIVAGRDIYGGTYRLLHQICNRAGIAVSLVDTTDADAIAAAIRPETKLLWIESPGNPLLSITDIAACAQIARDRGVLLGVDNTFASPVLTRPLELGAAIVMHSCTKYIGGHSDVLGGALVVKDAELYERLHFIQNASGATMGPFDAFLCSRGLKTLEIRVREQSRTAAALADYLIRHSKVARVNYPGLLQHAGHAVATRQMDGAFGAMLSFEVRGSLAETKRVCESTKLFKLAVSLGSVESLIEQPATMSHASYDPQARAANGISDGLIRVSVGLEAFEDLQGDLEEALGA